MLINDSRWLRGPKFLREPSETWPSQPSALGHIPNNDPEVKAESRVCVTEATERHNPMQQVFERHSSWSKLNWKTIAWVLRYKGNLLRLVKEQRQVANRQREEEGSPGLVKPIVLLGRRNRAKWRGNRHRKMHSRAVFRGWIAEPQEHW